MKATVVIAAYNAEKTIGACLESIVSQKPGFDFEIIVVDDGSRDGTVAVAKSFPKTRVLEQKHAGPAVGRNRGARSALGEIVVFTDSDCVLERNWLKEMVKPFGNREVAGVQGTYRTGQKELVARIVQLEIEKNHEKMAGEKFIDIMATYSAAYRRKVFLEFNGFDISFPIASGEDTDFSFRVHEAGYRMVFNPRAVVFHRHPDNLKHYLRVKFFRAYWRTKVYKRHKGKIAKDSYTSQMVKLQAVLFYLLVLAGLGLPFSAFGLGVFTGLFVVLLLTTLPFAVWAWKRDRAVSLVFPLVGLLRTAVFGLGLAAGALRELFGE
jgi:glycosyltransferase involved in cell wall biosynthesis